MGIYEDYKFERTVWAERELSKLCPNNDIKLLGDLLASDDYNKQVDTIENVIIILNDAYERKQRFLDPSHEIHKLTFPMLDNLNTEELMELSNRAFADFADGGETEVEVVPKKRKAEPKKSM